MGFVIINAYNYSVKPDTEMNGRGWHALLVEK